MSQPKSNEAIVKEWWDEVHNCCMLTEDEMLSVLAQKDAEVLEKIDRLRYFVARLYCASGCDCCRDTKTWDETAAVLAVMLGIPAYKDGSGFDFYKVRDEAPKTNLTN